MSDFLDNLKIVGQPSDNIWIQTGPNSNISSGYNYILEAQDNNGFLLGYNTVAGTDIRFVMDVTTAAGTLRIRNSADSNDKVRFTSVISGSSFINNGGNFGLGTNAPSQKVHMVVDSGQVRIQSTSPSATANFLIFDTNYGTNFEVEGVYGRIKMGASYTTFGDSATLMVGDYGLSNFMNFGADGAYAKIQRASTGIYFSGFDTGDGLQFKLNSDLAHDANLTAYFKNRVGIGTNAPTDNLQIGGTGGTGKMNFNGGNAFGATLSIRSATTTGMVVDVYSQNQDRSYFAISRTNATDSVVGLNGGVFQAVNLNGTARNLFGASYDGDAALISSRHNMVGAGTDALFNWTDTYNTIIIDSTKAVTETRPYILFQGGNGAAPTNTGEFRFHTIADSWVAVATLGSVGNFGVGTNGPTEKLHVVGNTRISSLAGVGTRVVNVDANGVLVAGVAAGSAVDGSGTTNYIPMWSDTNTLTDGSWIFNGNDIYPAVSGSNIGNDTSPDFRIGTIYMASNIDYLNDLNFNSGGNTYMTLSTAGLVTVNGQLVVTDRIDTINRILRYDATLITVDWADLKLFNSLGNKSVDWGSHALYYPNGTDVALTWDSNGFVRVLGTSTVADMFGYGTGDFRIGGDPNGTAGNGIVLKAYNGSGGWRTGLEYKNVSSGNEPDLVLVPNQGSVIVGDLAGTADRIVEADTNGKLSATRTIITTYGVPNTEKLKLEDPLNWDVNGEYIGTAIVNTYQGQKHYDDNYFYEAVADNYFIRLIRG